MKNRNSNLLWITIGMSVILCFAVLFGGKAYGEYRQDSRASLPEVFFTAMQDGIYPWSPAKLDNVTPEAQLLSEISQEALGPGVVKKETAKTDGQAKAAQTETKAENRTQLETAAVDSVKTVENEAGGPGVVKKDTVKAEKETEAANNDAAANTSAEPDYRTVGVYYLADACFIGDSFTEGLYCYAQIPKADYYAYQGVNTYSILTHKFKLPDGSQGTLEQALKQKQYGKIYLLLGINELGNAKPEAFAAHYNEVIEKIKALQPNAVIFIQSIFHTTKKKSDSTMFKNSIIDADNAALKRLADNKTVFYLDLNPLFDDETGALRSDYSGDGVHFKAKHYVTWRDFLLQHAIIKDEAEADR